MSSNEGGDEPSVDPEEVLPESVLANVRLQDQQRSRVKNIQGDQDDGDGEGETGEE